MITAGVFAGRRYGVFGLARTGRSVVASLAESGARVWAWDDAAGAREALATSHPGLVPEPRPFGASGNEVGWAPAQSRGDGSVELVDLNAAGLAKLDALVVSPGVPLNRHPLASRARAAGVPVIGDIELFAQAMGELPPVMVVGITGTNGKSTTAALLHHIITASGRPALLGGNIGAPILGEEALGEGGVYVLELSSFQIDLTFSLACNVAILLNITPDHLDRYEGMDGYAASKARLFAMQRGGLAVIAADDGFTRAIAATLEPERVIAVSNCALPLPVALRSASLSLRERVDTRPLPQGEAQAEGQQEVGFPISVSVVNGTAYVDGARWADQADWPALPGPANAQNAAAAIAGARVLGIADEAIRSGLASYPGLAHRMEIVRMRRGVRYVNDSKATNPTSVAPALQAYAGVHWIAGGQAKTDELDALLPHLRHVRAAYLIGEAAPLFARLLEGHVPVLQSGTLAQAVRDAAAAAEPGETVLLAPACASFDQFANYEARGDAFRVAVEGLA